MNLPHILLYEEELSSEVNSQFDQSDLVDALNQKFERVTHFVEPLARKILAVLIEPH